jgi:small subunit ribosomal protein S6
VKKVKKYETTFVLDAGVDEVVIDGEIKNVESIISANGGKMLDVERWGVKRFSYEIKKRHQGNYIHIKFEGDGNIPLELSKQYNINESILRHLTVLSQGVGGMSGALDRIKKQEAEDEDSEVNADLNDSDDNISEETDEMNTDTADNDDAEDSEKY